MRDYDRFAIQTRLLAELISPSWGTMNHMNGVWSLRRKTRSPIRSPPTSQEQPQRVMPKLLERPASWDRSLQMSNRQKRVPSTSRTIQTFPMLRCKELCLTLILLGCQSTLKLTFESEGLRTSVEPGFQPGAFVPVAESLI